MNLQSNIIFFFLLLLIGSSCSLSRTLPEGGRLYRGSKVKIIKEERGANTKQLKTIYKGLLKNPKPNKKFLGILWGVRFHNLFHSKKEKGLFPWLQRKLGTEPVVYDEQLTRKVEKVMENKAFNEGFFKVSVKSKMKKRWNKILNKG